MSTLGKAVIEFSADTAQFISDVGRASAQFERAVGRMERGLAGVKDAAVALVGFGGIGEAFKEIISRTMDAERSINLLNSVLRSTGYAAGLARTDIEALGKSLASSSAFDDDEIRKGINSLLRFQDVQGETFKEGARLAVDLAAAMGTSLPEAFTRVGRALSDPERGLRALREAGVFLSESQTDLAKKLFHTGDAAAAQKIILDELAKTVGGAAAGENQGLYGSTKGVEKAWDAFLKTMGGMEHVGSRVNRILNGITTALNFMRELLPDAGKAASGKMEEHAASIGAQAREWERLSTALQTDVDQKVDAIRKKGQEEYLQREKRLREEDLRGWVAHAEAVFKEAEDELRAIEKIWDEHWEREEKLRQLDIQGWVAHAEEVFRASEEELKQLERIQDEAERAEKAASQFGFTFESALENAILKGEKLRNVVKALADDIARMILRKTVTEPLGNAVGGIIGEAVKGIFGGGKGGAGGGAAGNDMPMYAAGTDYVPRTGLALLHQGEAVIPASENRGGAVNITLNVGSLDPRTAAHVIMENMPKIAGALAKAAHLRGKPSPV